MWKAHRGISLRLWSSWQAIGSSGRIARRAFSGVRGYSCTFFRGGLPFHQLRDDRTSNYKSNVLTPYLFELSVTWPESDANTGTRDFPRRISPVRLPISHL